MRRKKKQDRYTQVTGLLLLAAFLCMYVVQFACNVPHLAQRLQAVAMAPAAAPHSHHGSEAAPHEHRQAEKGHHNDSHSHGASSKDNCCSGLEAGPLLQAAMHTTLVPTASLQPFGAAVFCKALLVFCFSNLTAAISHPPPDFLQPKFPDIRVFLHSLII